MSGMTPGAHHAEHLLYDVVSGRPPCRPHHDPARLPPGAFARGRTARQLLLQTAVVVAAALTCFGIRRLTEGAPNVALRNAGLAPSAERFLHLDWETTLQNPLIDDHAITQVLNWIYIFGHWPVIALTMVWLLSRHHQVYIRIAAAMLLSGAIGLVLFAASPLAPPRPAGLGLTDTVTLQSDAYRALQPTAFVNQYAAMPGLHVGWNLLITLAVLAAAHKVRVRVVAVALTLSMDAAVVLTANHYMLDAIAGAALAAVSWYAAGRLQARRASPAAPDAAAARTGHVRPATSGSAAAPARLRSLPLLSSPQPTPEPGLVPVPGQGPAPADQPATARRLRPAAAPESQPAPLRPAG